MLLTVPLGILKYEQIDFDPPLSNRKKGAISRLGFGVLNKVSWADLIEHCLLSRLSLRTASDYSPGFTIK